MDFNFFSNEYKNALLKCEIDNLYEIRLRVGFPATVIVGDKRLFLSENGYSLFSNQAIIVKEEHINYIVNSVTEFSAYAFNDRIKHGYITTSDGIRIGLAGECVFEKQKIITIKNMSSLNIRIPHKISGCSNKILDYVIDGQRVYNTLLISPPFFGKTTTLKDLAENFNKMDLGAILIVDERGEFCDVFGQNIDKIEYCTKSYAFECGVRSLSPKIIITDELSENMDWLGVNNVASCGVSIVASCHGYCMEDLKNKPDLIFSAFERFIFLGDKNDDFFVFDKDKQLK